MRGLMTAQELCKHMNVSRDYVNDRRSQGDWVEGKHWAYLNPQRPQAGVRFIPELCVHWLFHQSCPKKHAEYVAYFHLAYGSTTGEGGTIAQEETKS